MKNNIREDFTIPIELVSKLKSYSKKTMIPKSRIISKLLEEFFEKQENIEILKRGL